MEALIDLEKGTRMKMKVSLFALKFKFETNFDFIVWTGYRYERYIYAMEPGPEVIKQFSCSTLLSMKFFPLINVKMPTFIGILTFMSGEN